MKHRIRSRQQEIQEHLHQQEQIPRLRKGRKKGAHRHAPRRRTMH